MPDDVVNLHAAVCHRCAVLRADTTEPPTLNPGNARHEREYGRNEMTKPQFVEAVGRLPTIRTTQHGDDVAHGSIAV